MSEYLPIAAISVSEIRQYLACRRKWSLSSFNTLRLRSSRPNMKLSLGTGVHEALELMYGEKADPVGAFVEWARKEYRTLEKRFNGQVPEHIRNDMQDAANLGRDMLTHYRSWAQEADSDISSTISVEEDFAVPIFGTRVWLTLAHGLGWEHWVTKIYGDDPESNPAFQKRYGPEASELWGAPCSGVDNDGCRWGVGYFIGRMDGLIRFRVGTHSGVWIFEHKTRAGTAREEMLILDLQTKLYAWAANCMIHAGLWEAYGVASDETCAGVLFNILRKKAPSVPKLLKSGRLSKAKNIDSTVSTYMAAIREHGFDPADYEDILDHLARKPNTFFQRFQLRRTPTELQLVAQKLPKIFTDMQRTHLEAFPFSLNTPSPHTYPSPTEDCLWRCDFREVCMAMETGLDAEEVAGKLFFASPKRALAYGLDDAVEAPDESPPRRM